MDRLASWIHRAFVRAVCGTLRYRWVGMHWGRAARERFGSVILAFWHSRFFPLIYTERGRRIHVLVSQSRDGELISQVLHGMGYGTVRGSTSRGGPTALRGLARTLSAGLDVAVTPDGPRGPREVAQIGTVALARLSRRRILPFATACWPRFVLPTWDRYQIPLPFARCAVAYGAPLWVPPTAGPGELEALGVELGERLYTLTAGLDAMVRRPGGVWRFGTRSRRHWVPLSLIQVWMRGRLWGGLRMMLWPLSQAWRAAARARRAASRVGILGSRSAGMCTVSVGNLTVGGTGKTPLVVLLARELTRRNLAVTVLSKGYGAPLGGRGLWTAVKGATPGEWRRAGDEAVLVARKTGAVVVSSRSRSRGIREVASTQRGDVLVLDDGFQALRVRRHFDIAVVSSRQPLGGSWVLPAGPLREGPEALREADLIVVTGNAEAGEEELCALGPPVVRAARRLVAFRTWPTGGEVPQEVLARTKVVAFAGVGDPQAFWQDLEHAGLHLAARVAFPNHHPYSPRDLHGLAAAARWEGAVALVTTEKDAVRLPVDSVAELPVWSAEMELLIQGEPWVDLLSRMVQKARQNES
jgi:tetraacyldisaccharide 4'-kinase